MSLPQPKMGRPTDAEIMRKNSALAEELGIPLEDIPPPRKGKSPGRPTKVGKPWLALGITRYEWYKRQSKAKQEPSDEKL